MGLSNNNQKTNDDFPGQVIPGGNGGIIVTGKQIGRAHV